MEPAWRQQGRGRGRGQVVGDASSLRQQRQEDGGRVGRVRASSAVTTVPKVEQSSGTGIRDIKMSPGTAMSDIKVSPGTGMHEHCHTLTHLSKSLLQLCPLSLNLTRSGSLTRLLLNDWLRASTALPLMMMKMMMRCLGSEDESWSRLSPHTPVRQVSADLNLVPSLPLVWEYI